MRVQVAQAVRPCPGFSVSGDTTVIRDSGSATLFGIVDVLGHGPQAATIADDAAAFLRKVDLAQSIARIIDGLHGALQRTRGAAAGLCLTRGTAAEVAVVGNIEVRSLGTRVGVIASPGIVGRRIRKLRAFSFSMRSGDRVALYSDGLSHVDLESTRGLGTARACHHLLHDYAIASDDASVVIADFSNE